MPKDTAQIILNNMLARAQAEKTRKDIEEFNNLVKKETK